MGNRQDSDWVRTCTAAGQGMHRLFWAMLVLTAIFGMAGTCPASQNTAMDTEALGLMLAKQAVRANTHWTTTDHSKVEALNKDFTSGKEITEACLSCHTDAAMQFEKTIHWTWKVESEKKGVMNGKAGHAVNNFCISGNNMQDKGCLSCHVGWNGVEQGVNCLNCHGGKKFNYKEALGDIQAFIQEEDEDSKALAKELQGEIKTALDTITLPQRQHCGECHFKGGGGDGVKHGDLDTSMTQPNRNLDVHMATDGANFACTRCHTTVEHNIAGRLYTRPASAERKSLIQDDMATKITCESCHGTLPHKNADSKMNDHVDRVACQSCHIPDFARVLPTMTSWDWSRAGQLKDGKPYEVHGQWDKPTYKSIKGEFTWDKNVNPQYFWYNGGFDHLSIKDVIDPTQVVKVSQPTGSKDDPNSRIAPFKIHRSNMPYDKVNKRLVAPLLSGPNGFWTTFDMNDAITRGNKTLDVDYSGELDYVWTTYAFPITHMVAPKANAVGCRECHIRKDSRLASITGIYLPGRDKNDFIDTIGMIAVLGAFFGVLLHGLGRFFTRNGKED